MKEDEVLKNRRIQGYDAEKHMIDSIGKPLEKKKTSYKQGALTIYILIY